MSVKNNNNDVKLFLRFKFFLHLEILKFFARLAFGQKIFIHIYFLPNLYLF